MKTKKVDGCDLPASAFAFVGDPENTSTWKLPIHFAGDHAKTRRHVADAVGRFAGTKLPEEHREAVKLILIGAAKALGIEVDHRFRSVPAAAPAPTVSEVKALPAAVVSEAPAVRDEEAALRELAMKELIALADFHADAFLKQLGLE